MSEVKIKYIEDKDIITPCYVTSDGEVYQIAPDGKTMELRNKNYIKKINKVVVTLRNKKCCKSVARQVILDSLVYKSFSTEEITMKRLKITHKDGDIYNCHIDNLVHNVFDRAEYQRKYREKSVKMAEVKKKKTLTLTEFSSFLTLFELMEIHKPTEITPNEVVLDTKYLSPEELNRLKKMKLDERVKII